MLFSNIDKLPLSSEIIKQWEKQKLPEVEQLPSALVRNLAPVPDGRKLYENCYNKQKEAYGDQNYKNISCNRGRNKQEEGEDDKSHHLFALVMKTSRASSPAPSLLQSKRMKVQVQDVPHNQAPLCSRKAGVLR